MKKLTTALLVLCCSALAFAQEIPADLLKKAEAGDAVAQNEVGAIYFLAEKLEEAKYWLEKSAKQYYHPAQALLGGVYVRKGDMGTGCGWVFMSKKPDAMKACLDIIVHDRTQLNKALMLVALETLEKEDGAQYFFDVIQILGVNESDLQNIEAAP